MKKVTILGLCLLSIGSAFAQQKLVKEVEREMKADPATYPKAMQKLAPAFTDAESAGMAYTWFVAGKGAFDYYDQQSVFAQMGKQVDNKQIGLSVIEGYDYLTKALPLDSVPDEKGKVKPKYSKDVLKLLVNHYNDFNNGALYLWQAEDYGDAVKAWNLYVSLPENQQLVKAGLKVPADTMIAEVLYNMGIGYSLAGDQQGSLDSFKKAIAKGYDKANVYDYAISSAATLNNPDEMAAIAQLAYDKFQDSKYIGYIVNNYIDKKQYAEADALVDKYISEDPQNANLYFVKGVLCDSEGNPDAALAAYRKSIELDENNAHALMQYGYKLYQKACDIDQNEGGNISQAEYDKLRTEKINPLFKEASTYLEKSYSIDNNMTDALTVLRSIYYNLNDEENLKRIESL